MTTQGEDRTTEEREEEKKTVETPLPLLVVGGIAIFVAGFFFSRLWGRKEEPVENDYVLTDDAIERCSNVSSVVSMNMGTSDGTDGAVCCVCLEKPEAFYMFRKCGHVCICERCAVRMGTDAGSPTGQPLRLDCPTCRQRSTLQRAFLSS
ncbi:hypothetical protein AGDE_13770 [Angomonas deanei]|nr:hypothetical protein AGDE_13770 [Angomonas deanei]|eukprot:EPY21828.1 hypothetical protein AGDE_13770 [Angomonas deanei]